MILSSQTLHTDKEPVISEESSRGEIPVQVPDHHSFASDAIHVPSMAPARFGSTGRCSPGVASGMAVLYLHRKFI